ncbi:PAS domain S-box protein [Haloplanus sp. C73]|uniref:PAS domain S-box protein n=1 Tax=Haloplanus sp. C73 TaxID=3421641 RepID=UPI003EBB982F
MDRKLGLDALRESPGFRGPVEPIDDHDHANGHFALIYDTLEERLAATIPFVRQGLRRGEKCVYVVEDASERETMVDALRESGVDVDTYLDAGALAFYTVEEVYFRSGSFDPDQVLSFYSEYIEDVLTEYDAFRVVAGTNWIDEVPFETFMEYEGRVNTLFDEHDAMAICHYDRTTLSSDVIRDVIRTHPHLIYDDSVSHNFYYTSPEELVDNGKRNEADRMLRTLQDRTKAKTELAVHERLLRDLNEIMASQGRSFEEKLQALFELGCERFDLELGGVNRVDRENDRFEVEYVSGEHDFFEPGLELPLSETYCRAPSETVATASVSEPVDDGFDDIAVYEEHGAKAYLGTYISISGDEDRTLAFISSEPRVEPFSAEDRAYIEMMGQWVKYELERKQREKRLERSKQRFQRIFENSQDAIFIVEPHGDEILEVNPAGCEMLGYDRAEILSRGPSDVHPDEMERFREFVNTVFEMEAGWTDELTCLRSDGNRIPVEMSASTIEYDGRECMLAIVRDISERKEQQRELERTERQFEATFNNPISFMGLLNPDGTVQRINENARQFVGVTNEDVEGEKFWETPWFTHSETVRENVREAVARAAAGEYVQAEIPHQAPDGETMIVDAMLEPVCEDGEVRTILASGHDVTERVRQERALRDAYSIIADADRSFGAKIDDLLELGRETLGVDYANLSRVYENTDEYVFERVAAPDEADLEAGDSIPLEATNCERVVETSENLVLRDVDSDAPELADRAGNADWGIACYLGTPVTVDNEVYGTFCFHDMETHSEDFSDWEVTFVDLLSDWIGSELEKQRDTDRLDALNNLNAVARDINRALADQSTREEIEQVVCEHLATSDSYEFAWIGAVDEDTDGVVPSTAVNTDGYLDEVTITADDSDTGRGPTGQAIRTGQTQVLQDIENDPEFAPWRESASKRGIEASASVPITYEDHTYGVLNIYSARTNAFDEEERDVIAQLGKMIGLTIAAVENQRRYRALAENIPNGSVALFDTDCRYLTAAGTIYDDLSIAPDTLEGNRLDEIDALPRDLVWTMKDAIQVALDGQSHTIQCQLEGRTFDVQFLPIRDDSGVVSAVMSLMQDVTEREEREAQLQHERERLELINRLLRHNLLNGLNVVEARLDILNGRVDYEVSDHLTVAESRTDEMIDLIQTLRSLTEKLIADDYELEPVNLETTLQDELDRAQESYESAIFETRADLADAPTVLADDLLEEVFENLLVNAVRHNDKDDPQVIVDIDVEPDTATVHFIDNGPGIPEQMQETIFEKGQKGFESPGTGFGLHLVREIVDIYDGGITVQDRDPTGTIFSITLPRTAAAE